MKPGPENIKLFMSMKFPLLIKSEILKKKHVNLSDVVYIMPINVELPTIVGILTFMCMINFMLSLA